MRQICLYWVNDFKEYECQIGMDTSGYRPFLPVSMSDRSDSFRTSGIGSPRCWKLKIDPYHLQDCLSSSEKLFSFYPLPSQKSGVYSQPPLKSGVYSYSGGSRIFRGGGAETLKWGGFRVVCRTARNVWIGLLSGGFLAGVRGPGGPKSATDISLPFFSSKIGVYPGEPTGTALLWDLSMRFSLHHSFWLSLVRRSKMAI